MSLDMPMLNPDELNFSGPVSAEMVAAVGSARGALDVGSSASTGYVPMNQGKGGKGR